MGRNVHDMNRVTLGIHDGHNAAASLLIDGRVVAAVQEERLTRNKNQGGIPRRAIEDILESARCDLANVDSVALNGLYMGPDRWEPRSLLSSYESSGGVLARARQALKATPIDDIYRGRQAKDRAAELRGYGLSEERQEPVEHHTAHAAAAYHGSGWQGPVLVVTCDGTGDRISATVSIGDKGRLERIASVGENESLGRLYAMVTYAMGMTPLEHEYKVMGLAPYAADARPVRAVADSFASLFDFDRRDGLTWRRRAGVPPMYGGYRWILRMLYRRRFDHIAGGLQLFLEEMLTRWIRNCITATGLDRVACAGGVFMNIKANKEILELPELDELFVYPSCGDETNAIGAAYWQQAEKSLKIGVPVEIEPLRDIYWGRGFDDEEAEEAIQRVHPQDRFHFKHVDDIERTAAEAIADGAVVARCKGRMEFGARALGNRSILARADDPKAVGVINDMIKNRDFWMPFAPVVLEERASDYYIKPKPMPAPYMNIGFDTVPGARDKLVAVQHPYDHSVRPQEIAEPWNADFYGLLKHYEEITGEGVLLNTSFNLHGDPIVYRPGEALDVFIRTELQYLALGNWWIWKR
jgi:carbamoyltransferase